MGISKRAKALQIKTESSIMEGHNTWLTDPFDPVENPHGILNFSTAQNHLMDDLLIPKINTNLNLDKSHILYRQSQGIESLRIKFCEFLNKHLGIKNLNKDNIIIQSGVTPICEHLSFTLFDEGDSILIPTPYFAGFNHTFTKRFGAKFIQVPLDQKNDYKHSIEPFTQVYEASKEKEKIKAILITHPHNPTGETLSKKFIKEIISFAKEKNLEIISDEIYALSSHWQVEHLSLYQAAREKNVPAHLLYGLAKDFSLPSFKVGIYYSEENEIVQSLKKQSYFSPVSIQTQELAVNILDDHLFITQFKALNQERLNKSLRRIKTELSEFNFLPSDAGLFAILDLSNKCQSFEDEDELFYTLLNKLRINITKGQEFGFNKPGYFRVCFAQTEEYLKEFCTRLKGL